MNGVVYSTEQIIYYIPTVWWLLNPRDRKSDLKKVEQVQKYNLNIQFTNLRLKIMKKFNWSTIFFSTSVYVPLHSSEL